MQFFTFINSTKAFTLVETLVAISIIVTATTLPMMQVQQSIKDRSYSDEQVLATFLAQEGVELVRSVRDSDRLTVLENGSGSEFATIDTCTSSNKCITDPFSANPLTPTAYGPLFYVRYNPTTKAYRHYSEVGSTVTKYTRRAVVERISDDERKVTVTVSWQTRMGTTKDVVATEHLFRFSDFE